MAPILVLVISQPLLSILCKPTFHKLSMVLMAKLPRMIGLLLIPQTRNANVVRLQEGTEVETSLVEVVAKAFSRCMRLPEDHQRHEHRIQVSVAMGKAEMV